MLMIIILVVTFVLFALLGLQIIYVRATIAQYEERYAKMVSDNVSLVSASQVDTTFNAVKAYGLSIDCDATVGLSAYSYALPERTVKPFLQYMRDGTVVDCDKNQSIMDVEFQDLTWLILQPTSSCATLRKDLAERRVKYLAIDDSIYMAHWSKDAQAALVDALSTDTSSAISRAPSVIRAARMLSGLDDTPSIAIALSRVSNHAPIRVLDAQACANPTSNNRFFSITSTGSSDTLIAKISNTADPTSMSTNRQLMLVVLAFRVQ